MANPLVFSLGEVELPDGRRVTCEAHVTINLIVDQIPAGDRGLFLEDHLKPVVKKLVTQLGDPMAWQAALRDGEDDDA